MFNKNNRIIPMHGNMLNKTTPLPGLREIEYHGGIEQEEFENNLKHRRDELEYYGWLTEKVTYKINEYDFRTTSMMPENIEPGGILCLGCSNTYGQGVNDHQTWPAVVERKTGIKTWNLGVPGGSYNTITKLAHYWIPVLKPQAVFVLETFTDRLDVLYESTFGEHNPDDKIIATEILLPFHIEHTKTVSLESFYYKWVMNDYNLYYNALKNEYCIKQMCADYNTPCIIMPIHKMFKRWQQLKQEKDNRVLARDLGHPGPSLLEKCADYFIEEYQHTRHER